jgi:hypothetical protein
MVWVKKYKVVVGYLVKKINMEILQLNLADFKNKKVGDFKIDEIQDQPTAYVFYLQRESFSDKVFFVRKNVIKASALNLENDVYELWYNDFQDAKLLTLSDVLNPDIVCENMLKLINKYSKIEK